MVTRLNHINYMFITIMLPRLNRSGISKLPFSDHNVLGAIRLKMLVMVLKISPCPACMYWKLGTTDSNEDQ